MAQVYAFTLLRAIHRLLRFRIGNRERRGVLVALICPFLCARSLLDAAQTCGVDKNVVYAGIDSIHPLSSLSMMVREGRKRLKKHLEKLSRADSSIRSRECVTLCCDDFVRVVRGAMGDLASPSYSGAAKGVVYGIRIQALIVVIGDEKEKIILDFRVIPPRHDGPGQQRATHGRWLQSALIHLEKAMNGGGCSLRGWYLSFDSAYATGYLVETARNLGLKAVSELKATISVWSWFWDPAPAKLFLSLFCLAHYKEFRPMNGDPEVEYLRHPLSTKIYGDILVVICLIGGIEKRFFTMDRTMKAITVRRVAKRRWWIERVFWDQKQLLGLPTIHQQTKRRVLTRVHLTFLLSQASIDAAKELGITTNRLHKILRRNPQLLIELIRTDSASVRSPEPANAEEGRLAA